MFRMKVLGKRFIEIDLLDRVVKVTQIAGDWFAQEGLNVTNIVLVGSRRKVKTLTGT